MIVLRNLVLSVVLVLASGCALMYNPNPQAVPVDSVPVGAEVFVDGEFMGVTPLILDVDNRASATLTLRLPDGREREVLLERRFDGASFAVSLVPAAVVGGAVLYGESRMARATSGGEWFFVGVITVIGGISGAGVAAFSIGLDAATGRWFRLAPDTLVIAFDD